MYNRAIFMGRLTRDPEIRQTATGKNVANFSIAVERRYGGQNGEERKADFFDCVAWEKQADFVGRWFTKGRMILAEGELQNRSYVGKDGITRYVTELIVDRVCFTGEKKDDVSGGSGQPMAEQPQVVQPQMNGFTPQPPQGYPQGFPQGQPQAYPQGQPPQQPYYPPQGQQMPPQYGQSGQPQYGNPPPAPAPNPPQEEQYPFDF